MVKLIIQIPCLNEAQTLPSVLADLPSKVAGVDILEILVIDDGSTDATSDVARQHGADYVLRNRRNCGLASTFSSGLLIAIQLGADVVVNTDGDLQYPGKYIEQLVNPILQGRADLVVGDRRPQWDKRNSWVKRLLYRIGRRAVSLLAGQDLRDPVSGFRAFSKEAAIRMHIITAYSYTIESLVQAAQKGLAIENVPIETNPTPRKSRLVKSVPSFVLRSATTLLRVVFMYRCLHLLVIASGILFLVGIIPIARFLLMYVIGLGDGHLQSLVLGSALMMISGLLLVAGLIADLVSHNRLLLERNLEHSRRSLEGSFEDLWSRHSHDASNM